MIKIKQQELVKHTRYLTDKIYQTTNLTDLKKDITISELLTYDFVLELESNSLYLVKK